jgi:hypothetical protein
MKEDQVKYKDFNQKDIKELIERINKNLDQIKIDLSKLVSFLMEEQKKQEVKIPEGYISYNFEIPIPKLSRLEYWLIGKINYEATRHQIQYIINKNRNNEIVQIFIKADEKNKEHLDHIINCCKWVSKTLKEIKERESQENKNIPSELL